MDVNNIVIGSVNSEPAGHIRRVLVFSVGFPCETMKGNSMVDQISIATQCSAARNRGGNFDFDSFNPVECSTQWPDGQTRAAFHKRDRGDDVETPNNGAGSCSFKSVQKFHFQDTESGGDWRLVVKDAK